MVFTQKYFKYDVVEYVERKVKKIGYVLNYFYLSDVYRVSPEKRENSSNSVVIKASQIQDKLISSNLGGINDKPVHPVSNKNDKQACQTALSSMDSGKEFGL